MPPAETDPFWIQPLLPLLAALNTGETGLSSADAASRLVEHGPNTLAPPSRGGALSRSSLIRPPMG